MIDHLSMQCHDVAASAEFYDRVLAPLGGSRVMEYGGVVGFGVAPKPEFWIGPRRAAMGSASHTSRSSPRTELLSGLSSMRPSSVRSGPPPPEVVAGVPPPLLRCLCA